MKIDMELISYLEKLSKLKLSSKEAGKAMEDLNKVLDFMDILDKVNTEQEEGLSHPFDDVNGFRADALAPSFSREDILRNAPNKNNEFFKAPKTVD